MLRARRHFCFIQTSFFVELVRLFVGDSKKKISSQTDKGQKKTTKSTRERTSFLDSILYARTHLYICALKTSRESQNSLSFYSVCFSFVGVYCDCIYSSQRQTYTIERVLFFSDLARVFFPPLPPQKKGEANFSSVFQRGWAATNAPRQNCAPTFTSGCE